MILRAALALTAVLVLSGPALAAPDPVAYDAKAAPLDDFSTSLLTGNGYAVRDDGKVWDTIAETPVLQADMPYLLSRLASAKRLRALLQINNIINRYDAERNITPEDKEAVRALVRENWVVFGIAPRNDFRSYFSIEELESLDKIPPRYDTMSPFTMTDPEPESVTADAPTKAAISPSVTALPPAAVAVPPSVTALPPAAAAVPPSVTALPPAAVVAVPPAVVASPAAVAAAPPVVAAVPPASAAVASPPAAPPAAVVPPSAPSVPIAANPPAVPVVIPPPPQAAAVLAAPASATAVAMNVIPTLSPLMAPPSLSRGSPFSPPVAPAAAPAPVAAPATAPAPAAPATTPAPTPAVVPDAAPVAAPAPAAPPAVDPHHFFTAQPAAPPPTIGLPAAAPAAPSTSAVVSSSLGTLKVWTPPAPSTATAVAPPKPAPVAVATVTIPTVAAAPPPPPPAPKMAAVGAAEYEAFVSAGPYTKEGKDLLAMIGKRAPDFVLPLLRRTVVNAVPQIVVDGARTGLELRAGFARDAADPLAPPIVALSPGAVYVEIKKGLFGGRLDIILPESERAWAELGVARPAIGALKGGTGQAPAENGDWGAVRVYADGSRRGTYSSLEQAGELLEQLLLLGLAREGLDASPYAARRWARTGRLMLEARLKDEERQDNFLDPDRRAELRDWLDHPDEADDVTVAAWSGSRSNILDPRRGPPEAARDFETRAKASCVRSTLEDDLVESSRRRARAVGALEHMVDAGVVDGAAAKAAAQSATDAEAAARKTFLDSPRACAPVDPSRDEGLRKAALLLAESSRAERLMREHKAGFESHAL